MGVSRSAACPREVASISASATAMGISCTRFSFCLAGEVAGRLVADSPRVSQSKPPISYFSRVGAKSGGMNFGRSAPSEADAGIVFKLGYFSIVALKSFTMMFA